MKYEGTKDESHSVRACSHTLRAGTVLHTLNHCNVQKFYKANCVKQITFHLRYRNYEREYSVYFLK